MQMEKKNIEKKKTKKLWLKKVWCLNLYWQHGVGEDCDVWSLEEYLYK